jgi:hypothetical protein
MAATDIIACPLHATEEQRENIRRKVLGTLKTIGESVRDP